ncbi:MAG: DUF1501 domain-containing protein [Phycisphaerales bacterium]
MSDHPSNACSEYVELSRRGFLAGASAATFTAMAIPSWLPRVSYASSHRSMAQDVIVQVYLRGGMDGLSVVVPWNETNYQNARPNIKVLGPGGGSNSVLDLVSGNTAASPTAPGGQVAFGFHPAMAALMGAYGDGNLAVVQATGLTNQSKSHFDAQKFMEVGQLNDPTVVTGWLGRHIATVEPMLANASLRAVGVADGLQRTLVGADRALPVPDMQSNPGTPPALNNFTNYGLKGTTTTAANRLTAIGDMYAASGGELSSSAQNTRNTIALLNQIGASGYIHSIGAGNNPTAYPTSSLGNALKSTAALINAQVGVEAVAIDYGGWDTHNNQGLASAGGVITDPAATMYNQINTLANALSAFYADIVVGKGRNVTVVVLSEFGRRVGQNGTIGTDHGNGNLMMALGSAVDGGRVITNWPGISGALPATNQDLGITIDYRDILSEIIVKRLGNGANLATIFPGFNYTDRHVIS